tara:strand:- start:102 stop:683 length:582 start_codon:yes stop_codon:yes gene_type:complete
LNRERVEKDFSWIECLEVALKKNRRDPASKYFQLATIRPDGSPANRTVVFRGFGPNEEIQLISDTRSQKISELKQKKNAAICWYFSNTREQFRISGIVKTEPSQGSDLARELWQKISEQARSQFYWPEPGHKFEELAKDFSSIDVNSSAPPEEFCVLRFIPTEVDYLLLRGSPQTRFRSYLSVGSWIAERINA